ncbi:F-box/FBD/LRR protein, partial [Trifolium pratense]
ETPKFAKELLNFAVVPDCLTSALQIVNFEKVKGDEQELFLAEFLLKNGKMLERMSFSLSSGTCPRSSDGSFEDSSSSSEDSSDDSSEDSSSDDDDFSDDD